MIKLVGFDLDGTVLNSLEDLASAINYALEKENLPKRSIEEVQRFIGDGVYLLLQRASGITDDENKLKRLKELFDEYYSKHFCDKSVIYDGIKPLLKKLEENDIKAIIYSNKPAEFVRAIIDTLLGEFTFYAVLGQCDSYDKKPDAKQFKEYQQKLGVLDTEVMYVGDSDVDIKTAKNANVISVGVTWGYRDREVIEKENPDYIVNSVDELLQIIQQ